MHSSVPLGASDKAKLLVFSPLPPEQNGIADYSYHLLQSLKDFFDCGVFVTNPQMQHPVGVPLLDHLQAFRYINSESKLLHQIGNNAGHIYVLDALRAWGGVTTLHDQNLHYLYEIASTEFSKMISLMVKTSRIAGTVYGRHWRDVGVKTSSNYALFDMLGEVLTESASIIVHSEFAKRRISQVYGPLCEKVHVIPHLALPFEVEHTGFIRRQLGLLNGIPLILTAGFATRAKRFDWLFEALDELVSQNMEFFWVHAGAQRSEEYDVESLLLRHPLLRERSLITGYLTETELNNYIAACDLLVNLRFPSVGESSGSLARAMSIGKCCIVSSTAAYGELPPDAVCHVSVSNPVESLVAALSGMLSNKEMRAKVGATAQRLAETKWNPKKVAAAYAEVLRSQPLRASSLPVAVSSQSIIEEVYIELTDFLKKSDLVSEIGNTRGDLDIFLLVKNSLELARITLLRPMLLSEIIPLTFLITSIQLKAYPTSQSVGPACFEIMLQVTGYMG